MIMYDNIEYARGRLVQTIIRIKDKAAMILEVAAKTVKYRELESGLEKTAKHSDMDLDPVPLGFTNYTFGKDNYPLYVVRMPKREDWRQGLRSANMKVSWPDKEGANVPFEILPDKSLADTIQNKFPDYKTAVKAVLGKTVMGMAFHRDFAIVKQGGISYKSHAIVGEVIDERGSYRIFDEFNWVREALEEAI